MRYPPERRDALLTMIRDWAVDGASRADILSRLEAMGHCRTYCYQLTRDANKRYALGWAIVKMAEVQETRRRGIVAIQALAAEGKRRSEAIRIVAEQLVYSYETVDAWATEEHIHFGRKPTPVASSVPPEARKLAIRIERDLRHEQEPVVTPCEYPADEGQGTAWGVAACYGNPARIVLAHDYDDWQRQYAPGHELQEAGD